MVRTSSVVLVAVLLVGACAWLAPDDPPPPPEYASIPHVDAKGIRPPRPIRRVEPVTPPGFASSGRRATAKVEIVVDATGFVEAGWLVRGDPQWGAAVLDAVRQWTFEPATRDGKPIRVRFRITSEYESQGLF